MSRKWQSNAQWHRAVYSMDGGITTDTHDSKEEAEHVCRALASDGFGGMRIFFPIRTWVSQTTAKGERDGCE